MVSQHEGARGVLGQAHQDRQEQPDRLHRLLDDGSGALSYLFDIDDSSYRDEMVYPKDLADYARSQPRRTPEAALRAIPPSPTEAGQACPREGWWSTSAKRDSRRYFALGEVFPAIPSATARGFVLWQWEDDQTVSPSAPLVQASSGEAAARVGLWRMDSDARVRCYVQQGEPLPLHSGQPVRWIWLEDTPGMRARSGEPCPYPGVWTCEEAPSISVRSAMGDLTDAGRTRGDMAFGQVDLNN